MDNGDPRFPYPRYLKVPFVFVPDGNPLPLEWMAAHPNYVTISAVFIPDPPREPNMGLEPQTRAEGQLELLQDVGTYEVVIDYAGNWTIRPVEPLTPQPAPRTEPPPEADEQAEPQPEEPIYEEPAPEPEIEPKPPPRPDYLRCVPPPGPRRARGGPPPLGPNPAARGMDPLAPEFTPNLVRKTARIMAGMDRVTRPGGIATPDGLSAAVRAGMQHLAAHKGDVRVAIASAKAAGAASADPEPSPPRPWPHGISKAEADRLFVAACHASAREAAQSTEVHARISPDADRNIDSVAVLNHTGSNSLGATIGGVVGEVAAGGLGSESGPLDVLITLAGRYGGRVLGSEIESAIKATESIIVHASADDDSNEGDKSASGQDQSSGSQAQTGGDSKNKRVSSKTLRTRWSKANNEPWPKDPKDPTRNQDVSHTKPLADGGDNSVENIKPLPHDEHVKQHIRNGDFSRWRRK